MLASIVTLIMMSLNQVSQTQTPSVSGCEAKDVPLECKVSFIGKVGTLKGDDAEKLLKMFEKLYDDYYIGAKSDGEKKKDEPKPGADGFVTFSKGGKKTVFYKLFTGYDPVEIEIYEGEELKKCKIIIVFNEEEKKLVRKAVTDKINELIPDKKSKD